MITKVDRIKSENKFVCFFCYGERTMSKKEAAEAGGQKKWYWAGR